MTDDTHIEAQLRALVHAREPVSPEEAVARSERLPRIRGASPEELLSPPFRSGQDAVVRGYRPSARVAVVWGTAILVAVLVVTLGTGVLSTSRLPSAITKTLKTTVVVPTSTAKRSPRPLHASSWPTRVLAPAPHGDVSTFANGSVYWLSFNGPTGTDSGSMTLFRYDLASRRITRGSSITGELGGLTVTGGWLWMVVGEGSDVVVEQLDTETLVLNYKVSLAVNNHLFSWDVNPVVPTVAATVDGPLWVAGDEDLWALNPSTGEIETEFDAGTDVFSMSTSPTGTLLYAGSQNRLQDNFITEYNADTGQEFMQTEIEGLGAGVSSATDEGVWIGVRTGMAGYAALLSASTLKTIAPENQKGIFNTYHQIMGVEAWVAGGVLWVSSLSPPSSSAMSLSCANPDTGVVRASEVSPTNYGITAVVNGVAYGFDGSDLLAIVPPSACFR